MARTVFSGVTFTRERKKAKAFRYGGNKHLNYLSTAGFQGVPNTLTLDSAAALHSAKGEEGIKSISLMHRWSAWPQSVIDSMVTEIRWTIERRSQGGSIVMFAERLLMRKNLA